MKLVRYKSNWADEMDISGFALLSDERWDFYKNTYEGVFQERAEFCFYIGTNEEMQYECLKDLMDDFIVTDIEAWEETLLRKLFDKDINDENVYGFFPPMPEDLL